MQIITSFFSKLDSFPVLKQEKVWLFSPDQFQTHSKKHGRRSQVFFRDNKIRTENCRIVQHLFWSRRQQRKILAYSQQLQSNSGSFSVVEQQQQELLLISQFTIQFVLYRMSKQVLVKKSWGISIRLQLAKKLKNLIRNVGGIRVRL